MFYPSLRSKKNTPLHKNSVIFLEFKALCSKTTFEKGSLTNFLPGFPNGHFKNVQNRFSEKSFFVNFKKI